MKTNESEGQQLLQNLLDAFNQGPAQVLALFNQAAIIEYPYAAAMEMKSSLNMQDYGKHLERMLANMTKIEFSALNVYPLQEPEAYWAEFHGTTPVPGAVKLYEQDYVVYFKLLGGKFDHYKEYWNILPILQTLLPDEEAKRIIKL